jgi:hypothetical protein
MRLRLPLVTQLSPTALLEQERPEDLTPPPGHQRKLRSSPEAARRRLLPCAPRAASEKPPPSYDDLPATAPLPPSRALPFQFEQDGDDEPPAVAAPPLPSPPPPLFGNPERFLHIESSRPRGLSAESFRMAVWTYSPKKKQSQATERTHARSYFNETVPNDIVGLAFGFLTISDLAIVSQVCRGWFFNADPWAYVEQHGWVPLGPLSRANRVMLRISVDDRFVAPELFRCIQFSCSHLSLELGGALAASQAIPPVSRTFVRGEWRLGEETPPLARLRSLALERPSVDDLRLLRERLLPRLPVISELRISQASLPVGAAGIVSLVQGTKLRELTLHKVPNITRGTLQSLFAGAPLLAIVTLEHCVFVADRAAALPSFNYATSAGNSTKHKVSLKAVADPASSTGFRVLEAHRAGDANPRRPSTSRETSSARFGQSSRFTAPPAVAASAADEPACISCLVLAHPCDTHGQLRHCFPNPFTPTGRGYIPTTAFAPAPMHSSVGVYQNYHPRPRPPRTAEPHGLSSALPATPFSPPSPRVLPRLP